MMTGWNLLDKYITLTQESWKQPDRTIFLINFGNHHLLVTKILDFHFPEFQKFSKPLNPSEQMDLKEFGESIMSITRWCFLEILTALEYEMKKYIEISTNDDFKKLKKQRNFYLSEFVKQIKKSNLLKDDDCDILLSIVNIRHILVHNGAVMDDRILHETVKNLFTQCKNGYLLLSKYDAYYTLSDMVYRIYLKWLTKNRDSILKINHTIDDPHDKIH